MHKPLEEYLAVVAMSLRPLPKTRRDAELREIRQHLQSAVTVNQESGQTEAEAVANALAQFGAPSEVSQSIVWAWRRDTMQKERKTYFRMLAFAPFQIGLQCVVQLLLYPHQRSLILSNFCSYFCFFASLMLGYALRLFLPTKFTPAWLVLERGPLGQTWPRLITACVVILCTVSLFNLPILGAKYEINPLANVPLFFLSVTVFLCLRCEVVAKEMRQDKENGDRTLGVA